MLPSLATLLLIRFEVRVTRQRRYGNPSQSLTFVTKAVAGNAVFSLVRLLVGSSTFAPWYSTRMVAPPAWTAGVTRAGR